MHQSSMAHMARFVTAHLADHRKPGCAIRVLDVGSADVNGSYRSLFPADSYAYTGADLEPGPGVDVVLPGPYDPLPFPDDSFDVLISGQALEHVEYPWVALELWARKLRPGGLACLIVPGSGPEHRYPVDCFRYLPDGLAALVRWAGLDLIEVVSGDPGNRWSDNSAQWADTVAVARRPQQPQPGEPICPPEHRAAILWSPAGAGTLRRTVTLATRPRPPGQPDAGETRTGQKWDRESSLLADPSEEAARRRYWTHHPVVRDWVNRRGGGHPSDWLAANLPSPARTVVSIGAGVARTELDLLAGGAMARLVLFDPSEGSLEAAVATALELGVADRVTAVPTAFAPEMLAELADVDAVLFISSLHHFDRVDELLAELRDRLMPGTRILADEYVGPNRFDFPATDRRAAAVAYQAIPESLRCQWPTLPAPDPLAVAQDDPSEAVDSAQILTALGRTFDATTRIWPIGGALAYQIWHGLDYGAVFETRAGAQFVRDLLAQDEFLTDAGSLPPYFARAACVVGR